MTRESLVGLRVAVFDVKKMDTVRDVIGHVHITSDCRGVAEGVIMGERYPEKVTFGRLDIFDAWACLFPDPFGPGKCFSQREPLYELIPVVS